MNMDIRIKTSFPSHPKTKKLINMVGPLGPWQLINLWIFAAQNKPDGLLSNMNKNDICSVMGYKGNPTTMIRALRECGFIDKHESGFFQLHDWKEHNSYACKAPDRIARARKGAAARIENLTKQRLEGSSKQNLALLVAENSSAPAPSPSPVPSPIEKSGFATSKNGNGNGESVDALGRKLRVFA